MTVMYIVPLEFFTYHVSLVYKLKPSMDLFSVDPTYNSYVSPIGENVLIIIFLNIHVLLYHFA